MRPSILLLPLSLFLISLIHNLSEFSTATSLSTNSRWIVDDVTGHRVKLACVNWPSHLEPVLAEGLNKQPLDYISKKIVSMGFNCVRFTWPTFLAVDKSIQSRTIRQSFQSLNLTDALQGIKTHNPFLLELPLVEAFKKVVANLGENKLLVILDNHISKPGWCCSPTDGNGFFGDEYFNPDTWIQGLTTMATMFRGSLNVIGMSLRNELRGARENVDDWYRYMQKGAEAVHAVNPKLLVILSGLHNDNDLGYIGGRPVQVSFAGKKLVFELHWYSFSNSEAWVNRNANDACGQLTGEVLGRAGFLLGKGFPLFMSEFGVDQKGYIEKDNRYLGCISAFLAEHDLDWAAWGLQGSYYTREGHVDLDEEYGVLAHDWSGPRNSTFLNVYKALQPPLQGPGISNNASNHIIFHPSTGQCLIQKEATDDVLLGSCTKSQAWAYNGQQNLALIGTGMCLQSSPIAGRPVKLAKNPDCTSWTKVSRTGMHFSTSGSGNNSIQCMDLGSDGQSVVTNPCNCLDGDRTCNPERQWFKLIAKSNAKSPKIVKNQPKKLL